MIFSLVLIIPVIASVLLYRLFCGMEATRNYWATAVLIAAVIAALRIAAVAAGIFLLEAPSGWHQLPAYFMVLCGLPEMYWIPKPSWGRTDSILHLSGLIVLGSAAWVFGLAALAARKRASSTFSGSLSGSK